MFFSLSTQLDERFTCHHQIGPYMFGHDQGWHQTDNGWFKGYKEKDNNGNWMSLHWDGTKIHLQHAPLRSFPLWWDESSNTLTNLLGTGDPIWADRQVTLDQSGLQMSTFDVLDYKTDRSEISLDDAVDLVCETLIKKSQNLKNIDIPKKMFLTGGADTTLLYSLMRYVGIDIELIDYEYIKYDRFLDINLQGLKTKHWAYKQIHHWDTPTLFITGSCGDEYLFRGPTTLSIWAAWHDINLAEIVKDSDCYHAGYFRKSKNFDVFLRDWNNRSDIKKQYPTKLELHRQLLNINANDHQHWHLGETLTWTPFLDLEFTKIVLSMDKDSIMKQVLDAELNRRVISKFYSPALKLLSKTKNDSARSNLHLLKSMV